MFTADSHKDWICHFQIPLREEVPFMSSAWFINTETWRPCSRGLSYTQQQNVCHSWQVKNYLLDTFYVLLLQKTWMPQTSPTAACASLARTPSAPAWNVSSRRRRRTRFPGKAPSREPPTAENVTTMTSAGRDPWRTRRHTSLGIECPT